MTRAGGVAVLAGAGTFVAVVTALHVVQPGYDPLQQLMSELALGRHGWAMLVAFAGLAVAAFAIQLSIAPLGASLPLRLLLIAAALSFLAAGLFPLGETSELHIAAIAGAFVLLVLAMYLFPSLAGRAAPLAPRAISWPLAAGVALGIVLGLSVVPMAVGQRVAALAMLAWLIIVGWRLTRRSDDDIA
jgi:hypothetical protein